MKMHIIYCTIFYNSTSKSAPNHISSIIPKQLYYSPFWIYIKLHYTNFWTYIKL